MTGDEGLLEVALEAVGMASAQVRTDVPGVLTPKGDRDMASEVDIAVERSVRALLRARTPEVGFLGEEEGTSGDGRGLVWVLDPVDGTANFVNGIELCAVSLGLHRDGHPVLGVIELPFLGTRYWATEGGGAYRDGRRLRSSTAAGLDKVIVSMGDFTLGSGAGRANRTKLVLAELLATRVLRVRMLGSAAIDLVWVAEGKLGATVLLANKPWDVAAGVVIAREAGALVLDADGTGHTVDSAATIAVAPQFRDELLEVVRRAGGYGATTPR